MGKYFGDQFFLLEEWFHKLKDKSLEEMYFLKLLEFENVQQAWYFFRGAHKRYSTQLGIIIVNNFMRKHPDHLEKLAKYNPDILPKLEKQKQQSMFQ